jgi:cytochrome c
VSEDRRRLRIEVTDLASDRVVYLRFDSRIHASNGEPLWVNEAWYTLNVLPEAPSPARRESRALETLPQGSASSATPNQLTEVERAAGWRLLFDGESFKGWKIYGAEDDAIAHWEIKEGALHFTRDVSFAGMLWNHVSPFAQGAVDLMTRERFEDFELTIDWRISEGGNSGIFYAVPNEETRLSWDLGLEMQILDDAGHMDGEIENHRAGDLYDLQSLARNAARPVGEWNTARIRVEKERIQHWLNGVKTADILRGGDDWNTAMEASKFDGTEGFGRARLGHLTLQDHGDPVSFRNIKIRELGIPAD